MIFLRNVTLFAVTNMEEYERLAARMIEGADAPIRLLDLLREYRPVKRAWLLRTERNPNLPVCRCVLLRRDLVRFAFGGFDKSDAYFIDSGWKDVFDRARVLFLKKWNAPMDTPRKRFGSLKIGGRWYHRKGITYQEMSQSYRILPVKEDLVG